MKSELYKKVSDIVRADLAARYSDDEFTFDPIRVITDVDEWGPHATGEEYLRIMIVFDGDQKHLDPSWTVGMVRRIRPKLYEAGVALFPNLSFAEKSEWQSMYSKLLRRYPELSHEPA